MNVKEARIQFFFRRALWNFSSLCFSCKNTSGVARLQEQSTATYCAVIAESGDLSLGLGDMDIHQQITEKYVGCFNTLLKG